LFDGTARVSSILHSNANDWLKFLELIFRYSIQQCSGTQVFVFCAFPH
jgi:hypothetical protein